MRNNIILILCLLGGITSKGQVNLDSLYALWQDKTQPDSVRINAYADYIWDGYLFSQPDSAFILAEELVDFGLNKQYPRAQFAGYTIQGVSWVNRSDYEKTLHYYIQALGMAEKIGNPAALAIAHNNLGSIYHDISDYPKALEHYIKSLDYKETRQMSMTLINIGGIYLEQDNYSKALEYIGRSLKINRLNGVLDEQAIALSKIGDIYRKKGDYIKSLDYYSQSQKIYEEFGHKIGVANIYNSIGELFEVQDAYTMALDNYRKGLKIYEEIGEKNGIAISLNNIGGIYEMQGEYEKALDHCLRGYEVALTIQSFQRKRASCLCLYNSYKAIGNRTKALQYLEILKAVEDSLATKEPTKELQQMEFQAETRLIQEAHEEDIRHEEKTRNIVLVVSVFFLLLAGSFYFRWRYVRKSKASLQIEKDRSENLLLNILPEEIARELKEKGRSDARDFDMVSILFTDFKSFTEQSAILTAAELVNELNHCFKAFDGIIEKYGIEKVKTIGDAYMAAGGVPIRNDDSVKNTVLAAIEMQEFIAARGKEQRKKGLPYFEMRAGIHTGPVVAGIVGVKKFQYDIWGDTVNTASRMESSGEVGKVNISLATYELIKDYTIFTFESRGKIAAKGKGYMDMYFVSKT